MIKVLQTFVGSDGFILLMRLVSLNDITGELRFGEVLVVEVRNVRQHLQIDFFDNERHVQNPRLPLFLNNLLLLPQPIFELNHISDEVLLDIRWDLHQFLALIFATLTVDIACVQSFVAVS